MCEEDQILSSLTEFKGATEAHFGRLHDRLWSLNDRLWMCFLIMALAVIAIGTGGVLELYAAREIQQIHSRPMMQAPVGLRPREVPAAAAGTDMAPQAVSLGGLPGVPPTAVGGGPLPGTRRVPPPEGTTPPTAGTLLPYHVPEAGTLVAPSRTTQPKN